MDWLPIIIIAGGLFLIWMGYFIAALKDPDVIEASKLKMNVNHYKKYREIFDEQVECHKNGKPIPNRINEIPNLNEWRRYGHYREELIRQQMKDDYNKILKGGK